MLENILDIKINSITIKNNELETDNVHVKRKLVDAVLYTDYGAINIEVNTSFEEYTRIRNTAYIMNIYSKYYLKGDDYSKKTNFVQINLNYNVKKDYLIDNSMLKNKNNEVILDNFMIYDLNMDKYLEFWYNKDEKEIEKYKYLIMLDLPKDELIILSKRDKVVSNYMEKLNTINEDPRFQSYMSAEEDDRKILNSIKNEYYDKGVEQGTSNRNIEIVRNMKKNHYSTEEISTITGIPKEEIEKI